MYWKWTPVRFFSARFWVPSFWVFGSGFLFGSFFVRPVFLFGPGFCSAPSFRVFKGRFPLYGLDMAEWLPNFVFLFMLILAPSPQALFSVFDQRCFRRNFAGSRAPNAGIGGGGLGMRDQGCGGSDLPEAAFRQALLPPSPRGVTRSGVPPAPPGRSIDRSINRSID